MALAGAVAPGCSREDLRAAGLEQPVLIVTDGDRIIAAGNATINRYAGLAIDAKKGDTSLNIALGDVASINLQADDLIMVMQMQGADINVPASVKDPAYGSVKTLGGAGQYELIRVLAATPEGKLSLDPTCGGLRNDYSVDGRTQVIRVPQYRTLSVNDGGIVGPAQWNGRVGGVLAFRSRFGVSLSGNLDATGTGFRGGIPDNGGGTVGADEDSYYGATAVGGQKGEGIAGYSTEYDAKGGRGGRGAPANGGGGGNAFRAGGGGGGGAGAATGWSGQGVMGATVPGAGLAWPLDPAYVANGNKLTTSPGGGRGGYSQSVSKLNPLQIGPGDSAWGGNQRRERGGLGGRPLLPQPQLAQGSPARLFMGGGGGAGDGVITGPTPGSGGRGGGVIFVNALNITTTPGALTPGRVLSNGQKGGNTTVNAGAGGGGGGGTVVLDSFQIKSTGISANGGNGGDQVISGSNGAEGPGGGGGGGYIIVPAGIPLDRSANGGLAGTTQSLAMNQAGVDYPGNGATHGNAGLPANTFTAQAAFPACIPADLAVSVTNDSVYLQPASTVVYNITVVNNGPYDAYGVTVRSTATPSLAAGTTWTCQVDAPPGASVPTDAIGCSQPQGLGDVNAVLRLPAGATATFKLSAILPMGPLGNLEVAATATPPGAITDIDPSNNTGRDSDPLTRVADLRITYDTDPTPPVRGAEVTYRIVAFNDGPTAADNVVANVYLPQGGEITGPAIGNGWECTQQDLSVTCRRPTLDPGIATFKIPYRFPIGVVEAYLQGDVSSDSIDPNLVDNNFYSGHFFTTNKKINPGGGLSCAVSSPGGPGGRGSEGWALLLGGAVVLLRRRRRGGR